MAACGLVRAVVANMRRLGAGLRPSLRPPPLLLLKLLSLFACRCAAFKSCNRPERAPDESETRPHADGRGGQVPSAGGLCSAARPKGSIGHHHFGAHPAARWEPPPPNPLGGGGGSRLAPDPIARLSSGELLARSSKANTQSVDKCHMGRRWAPRSRARATRAPTSPSDRSGLPFESAASPRRRRRGPLRGVPSQVELAANLAPGFARGLPAGWSGTPRLEGKAAASHQATDSSSRRRRRFMLDARRA
jgi:hypothetical protein